MAASNARFRLKQPPPDMWLVRERLALACSVMRSGDQNWVSVSRAIKAFGEPNRLPDWFSQKKCALQYSDLLEKVETPKRKRGDRELTETPGDVIVRKLTIERIEELKTLVQEEQNKYRSLQDDVVKIRAGLMDADLQEAWNIIQEKKALEEAQQKADEEAAAREQVQQRSKLLPKLKIPGHGVSDQDDSTIDSASESTYVDDESYMSAPSVSNTPAVDAKLSPTGSPSMSDILGDPSVSMVIGHTIKSKDGSGDVFIKMEPQNVEIDDIVDMKEEIIMTTPEVCGSVEIETEVVISNEIEIKTEVTTPPAAIKTEPGIEKKSPSALKVRRSLELKQDTDKEVEEEEEEIDVGGGKVLSDDEAPPSPSSSVISSEADFPFRGKARRTRGGRGKGSNRRNYRFTRRSRGFAMDKESETSSKAESSDDDGDQGESDDTASNMTGRGTGAGSESVPGSPASFAPGDTEDEKAHKIWKKSIMLVWRAAANHKYANVFLHPVTEDIARGYLSVVIRPTDLTTIKKNIENCAIKTTAEFQRDMMLMFTNAHMYNNSNHDVHHMAIEMYDDVMAHIEQFMHTQIMVQSEPKMLRTSRRSEVQSDKEDEPKRKRVPDQDGGKAKKQRKV